MTWTSHGRGRGYDVDVDVDVVVVLVVDVDMDVDVYLDVYPNVDMVIFVDESRMSKLNTVQSLKLKAEGSPDQSSRLKGYSSRLEVLPSSACCNLETPLVQLFFPYLSKKVIPSTFKLVTNILLRRVLRTHPCSAGRP